MFYEFKGKTKSVIAQVVLDFQTIFLLKIQLVFS